MLNLHYRLRGEMVSESINDFSNSENCLSKFDVQMSFGKFLECVIRLCLIQEAFSDNMQPSIRLRMLITHHLMTYFRSIRANDVGDRMRNKAVEVDCASSTRSIGQS